MDEQQLSSDLWSVACRLFDLKDIYKDKKFKFDELNVVDLVDELAPMLQDASRVIDSQAETLTEFSARLEVLERGLIEIVEELFGKSYANNGENMLENDTRTCADILEQVKKLKEEKE